MTVSSLTLPAQPTPALPALPAPRLALAPAHRGPIGRDEAAALTAAIRATAAQLWLLVAIAHERKAWRALGYDSWKDYVAAELALSESRSFQLVETGRVMLAIADAAGVPADTLAPVPYRTVAAVKDSLPALRRAVRTAVTDAAEAETVTELGALIAAALAEVRAAATPERPARRREPVGCPVCAGTGSLGHGRAAVTLAERAARWIARYR